MRLILVQHGEAVPKTVDPDRPLSETGRADAATLADFLAARGLGASRLHHSGKTRAHQTAEILAARFAPAAVEAVAGLAPDDPVAPWVEHLTSLTADTVLVGHQPFLGRLTAALLNAADQALIHFHPGTAVCLERTADRPWTLTWVLPPSLLQAAE